MLEHSLNIGGSEWMIIIFVAVVLVLGTGKLPGVAKKMGKVMSEYNNAKNEIQQQMKEVSEEIPKISGPVETEREKLEMISKSAGIKTEGKTDEELQKEISLKMGQKTTDTTKKTTDTTKKTTDTTKIK
ncbi:twin-arginine translocase TatA/TatE family subunit [Nitrosopumilus sp.]|nr:twin-arginine translocase TatA/TatE family subunit [Nitrosopumilus sp.]